MYKAPLRQAPEGENRRPVREFFNKYAVELPKRKWGQVKENNAAIRNAFLNRNLESGEVALKSTIAYPASQIVANRVANIFIPATAYLFTQITAWSKTAQAIAGGLIGDYVGNVLGFAAAWLVFNAARYRKVGMGQFVKDVSGIVKISLVGVGIKFAGKIEGKIAQGESGVKETLLKIAKPFAFLAGAAISPVPVSYYIYAPMIAVCVAIGMHPAIAALVGGFGATGIFMMYTNLLQRKDLKRMDEQFANGGKKE